MSLHLNLIWVVIEQCTFLGNGNGQQDCVLRKFQINKSIFLLGELMLSRWPTRQPNKGHIYGSIHSRVKVSASLRRGNVENAMNFNSYAYIFVVALTLVFCFSGISNWGTIDRNNPPGKNLQLFFKQTALHMQSCPVKCMPRVLFQASWEVLQRASYFLASAFLLLSKSSVAFF